MTVDCTGRFKRDGGDICWAGIHESKPLTDLHKKLSGLLRDNGFSPESRAYSPHITLGREVVLKEGFRFGTLEPIAITVSSVELMKSERIGGKLTYTAIITKPASNL